jgi:hypothetical protein
MTNARQAAIRFVENGGKVSSCGNFVFGISGKQLKKMNRSGYYFVNVYLPSTRHRHRVHIHKIVAYMKYGSEYVDSILVRHLDGNKENNSFSNIAIGSHSDNSMDRDRDSRRKSAQIGGKSASRYSDGFWESIRLEHQAGSSYKSLRKRHGIPISTLSYQLTKVGKRKRFICAGTA